MEGKSKNKKLKDSPEILQVVDDELSSTRTLLLEQDAEDALEFARWTKKKSELRYRPRINHGFFILNNCIYWAYLGANIGSEEDKHRPVLVVRTEKNSEICTIIPLTNQRLGDGYWYHIDLEEENSTALVEQLRVISKNRIDKPKRKAGKTVSITEKDWKAINNELKRLYCLKALKRS
ncbi:type II toxin-antitoxin system PemK/MazF family toxin [Desulforamulus ferrireducens]|uniref:Uncharacterized protein n=1 Tax=Desulforamulus ferrireducens TaxID=1833852 RepID=A0A1S6ISM0_9FIRM|nr:type II toxin-antitoxin system PemK/MazF family toxin [Desulforamulus ferrireducens]AQS57773.1 hypothetical protein B0537_00760 [Desulforamulus ferrireducens]